MSYFAESPSRVKELGRMHDGLSGPRGCEGCEGLRARAALLTLTLPLLVWGQAELWASQAGQLLILISSAFSNF